MTGAALLWRREQNLGPKVTDRRPARRRPARLPSTVASRLPASACCSSGCDTSDASAAIFGMQEQLRKACETMLEVCTAMMANRGVSNEALFGIKPRRRRPSFPLAF